MVTTKLKPLKIGSKLYCIFLGSIRSKYSRQTSQHWGDFPVGYTGGAFPI